MSTKGEISETCAGCDYWPTAEQRADCPVDDIGRKWCRKWHTGLPLEWPGNGSGKCHEFVQRASPKEEK